MRRYVQRCLHEDDINRVKTALDKADTEFGFSLLNLNDVDFETDFQTTCDELMSSGVITNDAVIGTKQKCMNFLKRLLKEMVDRFPENIKVISKLNVFNPYVSIDSRPSRPKASDLPWELAPPKSTREDIELQWRRSWVPCGKKTYVNLKKR